MDNHLTFLSFQQPYLPTVTEHKNRIKEREQIPLTTAYLKSQEPPTQK